MNNLIFYINTLKQTNIPKYTFIGITCELILSKELFKSNSDLIPFLKDTFDIEFLPYVMKSRTTIISRMVRTIYSYDKKQFNEYRKKLIKFLEKNLTFTKENYKEGLSGWL